MWERRQKQDLSEIRKIASLLTEEKSEKEIRQITGRSQASVNKMVHISRMTEDVLTLVEGNLSLSGIYVISQMPSEQQLGVAKEAVAQHLSARKIEELIASSGIIPGNRKKSEMTSPNYPLGDSAQAEFFQRLESLEQDLTQVDMGDNQEIYETLFLNRRPDKCIEKLNEILRITRGILMRVIEVKRARAVS